MKTEPTCNRCRLCSNQSLNRPPMTPLSFPAGQTNKLTARQAARDCPSDRELDLKRELVDLSLTRFNTNSRTKKQGKHNFGCWGSLPAQEFTTLLGRKTNRKKTNQTELATEEKIARKKNSASGHKSKKSVRPSQTRWKPSPRCCDLVRSD